MLSFYTNCELILKIDRIITIFVLKTKERSTIFFLDKCFLVATVLFWFNAFDWLTLSVSFVSIRNNFQRSIHTKKRRRRERTENEKKSYKCLFKYFLSRRSPVKLFVMIFCIHSTYFRSPCSLFFVFVFVVVFLLADNLNCCHYIDKSKQNG